MPDQLWKESYTVCKFLDCGLPLSIYRMRFGKGLELFVRYHQLASIIITVPLFRSAFGVTVTHVVGSDDVWVRIH